MTFNNTATGGDGTLKTVTMKFGEQLPTPTSTGGYTFEGWYEGDAKITKAPEAIKTAITGKYVESVKDISLELLRSNGYYTDELTYYYNSANISLTSNTSDLVKFIINGNQMKSLDSVRTL